MTVRARQRIYRVTIPQFGIQAVSVAAESADMAVRDVAAGIVPGTVGHVAMARLRSSRTAFQLYSAGDRGRKLLAEGYVEWDHRI